MPSLSFTPNIARHVRTPGEQVAGATLREALEAYFRGHPEVRSYVLDDQGCIRKHVAVFINGELVVDRHALSDRLAEGDDIYVMQALSGG